MRTLTITVITVVALLLPAYAGDEDKNVTIIKSTSAADGKSDVSEKLLEECIVSLPNPNALEPIIVSESNYLKGINGDSDKNDYVKTYTATLEINYKIKQKVLIVVTTSSVQGQEPVMKVLDKELTRSKKFSSNSADGDLFAGRSRRTYYFSTSDGAKKDVLKRASAWINQQSAIVCTK